MPPENGQAAMDLLIFLNDIKWHTKDIMIIGEHNSRIVKSKADDPELK